MSTEAAPANTDRFNPIAFQLKSLKTFGFIQMVLGGILATIGGVGLVLDKSKKDCSFSLDTYFFLKLDFLKCENKSNDLIGMDGACLGLSIWVMVTGAIPMFMTQKRETEWRSLRLAFMVCSIIGASAIVPTIGALGLAGLHFRRALLPWAVKTWAISVAIMITAFLTFVLTIVSCSYSLCCAPKPEKEQTVCMLAYAPGVCRTANIESDVVFHRIQTSKNYTSVKIRSSSMSACTSTGDSVSHEEHDNIKMSTEAAPSNTDRFNPIAFELKSLKTFGVIQMVLGGILATIGVVGLILDKSKKDCYISTRSFFKYYTDCENRSNDLIGMDGACVGLSILVIVTGAIPMFMTQKRETEWRSLRLAFMVCSIIGASAIVPTIGALGLAGLIFRREVLPWAVETWPTSVAIMITAFVTFVLTIVSCSYSLCCAPKPEKEQSPTNINVANVIPGQVPGYQFPIGYQHNPYQQGQMPMQFTEAG